MIDVRRPAIRSLSACLVAAVALTGCASGRTGARVASPSASTAVSTPAGATGAAAPSVLLGEVQRELSAMKSTHYQHTTAVDETAGKFFYDCSGMVDYALGRVLPSDAVALPTSTSKRPLAGDIEGFLHSATGQPVAGWQGVTRVDQLGPGDLVAWQATEDSTTGDTGHVMVVLVAPTLNAARNGEWLVQVADSTVSPMHSTAATVVRRVWVRERSGWPATPTTHRSRSIGRAGFPNTPSPPRSRSAGLFDLGVAAVANPGGGVSRLCRITGSRWKTVPVGNLRHRGTRHLRMTDLRLVSGVSARVCTPTRRKPWQYVVARRPWGSWPPRLPSWRG